MIEFAPVSDGTLTVPKLTQKMELTQAGRERFAAMSANEYSETMYGNNSD